MNAPSFSVVIETANLSLADLDGLRVTLESLADQSLPIQTALDVLIMDSGDVPEDLLRQGPGELSVGSPHSPPGWDRLRRAEDGRSRRCRR